MRRLVYLVATSLDGFIAGPDDDISAFPFEGPEAADLIAEFPEMLPGHVRPHVGIADGTPNRRFDTVLMGRRTYDPALTVGITSPYAHLRQLVVSRSLGPSDDVEVVSSDVVERVRALKQEDGLDVWLAGGGELAAVLADEIDEFVLKTHPLVLGAGTPVLGPLPTPRRLAIHDRTDYPSGFSLVRAGWASPAGTAP